MNNEGQDLYSAFGSNHWWLTGRYWIFKYYYDKYCSFDDLNILDVGCGPAVIYEYIAADKHVRYIGLDASYYGLKLAKDNIQKNVFTCCDILHAPFNSSLFDVVIGMDIIEHIDDDTAAVKEIHRLLKPGGLAFFCVPAFNFLWGDHDDRYGHKRRYTKESFAQVINTAKLDIVDLVYGQTIFFVPLFIFRQIRKFKRCCDDDFARTYGFCNKLLYFLMVIDFKIFRYLQLPLGCNIFCVAKKTKSD